MSFATATFGDSLETSAGGQRQLGAQYGFTPAQHAVPIVAVADYNFVSDARLLRVGACGAWDTHSLELPTRPFVRTPEPWHSRTLRSYSIAIDSPLRTLHGFKGGHVATIGLLPSFVFDPAAYNRRSAFGRIDAERYDRTRGLWTVEGQALGFSPKHFNTEVVEPVPAGSWSRYDGVDFGEGGVVSVRLLARPALDGATVRFQLGSPDASGLLIASARVANHTPVYRRSGGWERLSSAGPSSQLLDVEPSMAGFVPVDGTSTGATVPRGMSPLFMVFAGVGDSAENIGASVDWFRFVRPM